MIVVAALEPVSLGTRHLYCSRHRFRRCRPKLQTTALFWKWMCNWHLPPSHHCFAYYWATFLSSSSSSQHRLVRNVAVRVAVVVATVATTIERPRVVGVILLQNNRFYSSLCKHDGDSYSVCNLGNEPNHKQAAREAKHKRQREKRIDG